jgi:hypothetical protein
MHPERLYRERVPKPTVTATVEWWSDEEGWGALTGSDEMPHECPHSREAAQPVGCINPSVVLMNAYLWMSPPRRSRHWTCSG